MIGLPVSLRALAVGFTAIFAAVMLWLAYSQGRDDARGKVETENRRAVSDADAAALSLDQCLARRGVYWDFTAGKCRRDR